MYAFGIESGRFTRASGKVGVNENDGTRRSRGTDGSNPVPSSRESGEIVGSATLAGRGRCFTAPRLFIWGLSISMAPLQAWTGNVLAT